MAGFVKGEILKIKFPFTDLTQSSPRPAFVVKQVNSNDLLVCPITKQIGNSSTSIELNKSDFESGSLKVTSYIRIEKIFTLHKTFILDDKPLGKLNTKKATEVIDKLCQYIKS